jgi:hypothetical protein
LPGGEGWANDLTQQLNSTCSDEKKLRFWDKVSPGPIPFKRSPYFLPNGRPTGVLQPQNIQPPLAQPVRQKADLSGFSTALNAFEGDESSAPLNVTRSTPDGTGTRCVFL